MNNMRNNNRRPKREHHMKHSIINKGDNDASPLWSVFSDAPEHRAIEYTSGQIRSAGANVISDDNNRHIIVNKRRNTPLSTLAISCVGSIIAVVNNKLTLLSYMPPSPIKLMDSNINTVTRNFDNYTVYPITDGTSIGLYFFNDKWIIRTLNGYDVGQYKWNGDMTYWDVFTEVMSTYKSFSFDRLDKRRCYTIIIKHPAYHPFREGGDTDIMRATLVHSIDCVKVTEQKGVFHNAVSKNDDIGIPFQTPLVNATMHTIMRDASNAYEKFINGENVSYGAILIPNIIMGSASISVPSTLYDVIISTLYTNTLNNNIFAGAYDRKKYMMLNTYLHINRHNFERFQKIFPQYVETTSHFENVTNEIVESMVTSIEKKQIVSDDNSDSSRTLIFNNTVRSLLRQLSSHAGGVPKIGCDITQMIGRFVRSASNITTLYDLMYYNEQSAIPRVDGEHPLQPSVSDNSS